MTNYTPNDDFATVQRYDTSDLVRGGATGESSLPIEQLADRTEYLHNRLGGYLDVADVTGNASIDVSFANKLICVAAGGNVTLLLDALSTFKKGARVAITAAMSGGPFWVNVVPAGADAIADGSVNLANVWLYNGEMIELVAGTAGWKWTIAKGNFGKIGQDDLKRIQPRNTLIADGTLGDLRSQYPRLWAAVSGGAVSDFDWSVAGLRYQGFFSTGNGSTNFRRPDMRAMSYRALDLSRGVSLSRLDDLAGGYQADDIKAHTHTYGRPHTDTIGGQYEGNRMKSGGDRGLWSGDDVATSSAGVTENTVKNIGFLPVIYY